VELHYEVVDLHEAIRGAVAMFQSAIDAKSQELSLALRARQHHVWADPGRLQQVLINLISNAVKFTGENGAIWINSANVLGESIEIEISDNGVGIENELLSRLFSAFEQSEQSRRLGGLGLGLSIAKSLAEMHRGKLTAVSDGRDRGSTFQLTLATMLPKEKAVSPPSSVPIPKFAQRILLVEDHADTRIVMARLLTSIGCQVTTAGCVSEALAAAETGTFDLLISDIGLPDGTGLDVMRSLKSRIDRGIALSGFGQEEDLRRSIEAGFEMHLIKPINFNTLKEVLRKAG
jgi:CheY-like chemotaxis protein